MPLASQDNRIKNSALTVWKKDHFKQISRWWRQISISTNLCATMTQWRRPCRSLPVWLNRAVHLARYSALQAISRRSHRVITPTEMNWWDTSSLALVLAFHSGHSAPCSSFGFVFGKSCCVVFASQSVLQSQIVVLSFSTSSQWFSCSHPVSCSLLVSPILQRCPGTGQ